VVQPDKNITSSIILLKQFIFTDYKKRAVTSNRPISN